MKKNAIISACDYCLDVVEANARVRSVEFIIRGMGYESSE